MKSSTGLTSVEPVSDAVEFNPTLKLALAPAQDL